MGFEVGRLAVRVGDAMIWVSVGGRWWEVAGFRRNGSSRPRLKGANLCDIGCIRKWVALDVLAFVRWASILQCIGWKTIQWAAVHWMLLPRASPSHFYFLFPTL